MKLTKTEELAKHTLQQCDTPRIYVDNAELSVTEKFPYLGPIITSDFSLDEEVTPRNGLASFVFGRLTHPMFVKHRLSIATKRSVYQVICISILLFRH